MLTASKHCQNLNRDRDIGQYWERQFCIMAGHYDKSFTPMQLDRSTSIAAHQQNGAKWNSYTLPDVIIWTAPGEHHEIKHKNPFTWRRSNLRKYGPSYGLEVYRFNALLWFAKETGQSVMYTIHNHDKAGGRNITNNDISHWETANILKLDNQWYTCKPTNSYVNGVKKTVDAYYWQADLWKPLNLFWQLV